MATPDPRSRVTAKSATAFRTISEVSGELDVPQHVLRFWETKFPQIRPLKRGGGRRYYRPEDVELLRRIQALLYKEGYTIKGVQRLLRETRGGVPGVEDSAEGHGEGPGEGPAGGAAFGGPDGAVSPGPADETEAVEPDIEPEPEPVAQQLSEAQRLDEARLEEERLEEARRLKDAQRLEIEAVIAELVSLRDLLRHRE